MGGKLHRDRLRKNGRDLERRFGATKRYCPNCKELLTDSGHFVPPSMGGLCPGQFICEKKEETDQWKT